MTCKLKISAIIPTYNGEKYIAETIHSIINQSIKPHEIIISDDQSTDTTTTIVKKIAETSSIPIKLVVANHSGISNNYLHAVKNSVGDIIIIGDHDDIWKSKKIEKIASSFNQNPEVLLVCSDSLLVDNKLNSLNKTLRGSRKLSFKLAKLSQENNLEQFIKGLRFDAHTLAFKRNLLPLITGPDFEKLNNLWFENKVILACMSLGKYDYLPDALTLYRQHTQQHTNPSPQVSLSIEPLSREDEIQLLIDTLENSPFEGCMIDNLEQSKRVEVLRNYHAFLLDRKSIKRNLPSLMKIISNFILRRYYHFTRRSLLSFLKDLARLSR